jgi:hypothetical protein
METDSEGEAVGQLCPRPNITLYCGLSGCADESAATLVREVHRLSG